MKGKMIKLLAAVMSAFFIFYAGYQAYRFFYNPYQTEITTEYSVSEALHVHGVAVRSETLIESEYASGSVSYVYEDAQRVLKNKTVAYTHASADTVDKMIRAEELEKEISLLQEASRGNSQLYGTMEFINTQIGSAVADYAEALDGKNLSALSSAKESLLLAINKKTVITGEENKFEDRIAILSAECSELKDEIGADAAETVVSPKTGYFISEVDGFEGLINKENMLEMTAAQLEDIIETQVVTVEPAVGKIADDYKWYYVISVSDEEAKSFYEGRSVEVNFDGINDSIKFKVDSVLKDETSENTIVFLLCEKFTSEVASLRQVSADIVFSTISGLRVSQSAVRFDNEQNMGVFILDRGEVKFRKIEISYEGNGYVIAKWYRGETGNLQLYDEVFTTGSDLYVGKVID